MNYMYSNKINMSLLKAQTRAYVVVWNIHGSVVFLISLIGSWRCSLLCFSALQPSPYHQYKAPVFLLEY